LIYTYEGILQITKPPDHRWTLQDQLGWQRCLQGYLSTEWLEYISIVQVEGKSEVQIGILKVWHLALIQQNNDIDPTSRYHIQLQEYQHKINLKTIYECFTIMGRSDLFLLSNVDVHLQDTRDNIACWVAMYRDTLQAEIDTFDPGLWNQVHSKI
jgi:hypothetical protein